MARHAIVALLLAALVAGSSAFYSDSMVQEALADAQRLMASQTLPARDAAAEPSLSRLMVKTLAGAEETLELAGPSCACKKCTMGSAHWVMDHVIEYLKEKCESTECPVVQKMCDRAKAHPKVAFGFLFAAVRPISLGYAWCNGKGECGKEEDPAMACMASDEFGVGQSIDELQQLLQHEPSSQVEMIGEVQATLFASAVVEGFDALVEGEAEEKSMCKGCIKVTSTIVMFDTIHKIKHYCRTTESEMVKKHCKMAKEHPQEAFGYLAYKLRPGEWGCGYCFGNKMCSADAPVTALQREVLGDMAEEDSMVFATLGEYGDEENYEYEYEEEMAMAQYGEEYQEYQEEAYVDYEEYEEENYEEYEEENYEEYEEENYEEYQDKNYEEYEEENYEEYEEENYEEYEEKNYEEYEEENYEEYEEKNYEEYEEEDYKEEEEVTLELPH